MPSKDPKIQKAYKDGVITKGQYEKLSDGLLLGIIKKKSSVVAGTKETRKKVGKEAHKKGRPKKGSKVEVS